LPFDIYMKGRRAVNGVPSLALGPDFYDYLRSFPTLIPILPRTDWVIERRLLRGRKKLDYGCIASKPIRRYVTAMARRAKFPLPARFGDTVRKAVSASPSPSLAKNHLRSLIEAGGTDASDKIPARHLPDLIRLLGSSSFLSEVLIREGQSWPDLFLRQIESKQKTAAENLAELNTATKGVVSFDDFCAELRRYKQREYLRIGARDLEASVTMEETVKGISARAHRPHPAPPPRDNRPL
jgi:hypothetical protein